MIIIQKLTSASYPLFEVLEVLEALELYFGHLQFWLFLHFLLIHININFSQSELSKWKFIQSGYKMKTWLITARIWSSRSICALDNRLGLKYRLISYTANLYNFGQKNRWASQECKFYRLDFDVKHVIYSQSLTFWAPLMLEEVDFWLFFWLSIFDFAVSRAPFHFIVFISLETKWRPSGYFQPIISLDRVGEIKVWKLAWGRTRRYRFLHTAFQFLGDLLRS